MPVHGHGGGGRGGGVRQSSLSEDNGGRGQGSEGRRGSSRGSRRVGASPTELLRAARGPLTSEHTVSLLQALCAERADRGTQKHGFGGAGLVQTPLCDRPPASPSGMDLSREGGSFPRCPGPSAPAAVVFTQCHLLHQPWSLFFKVQPSITAEEGT